MMFRRMALAAIALLWSVAGLSAAEATPPKAPPSLRQLQHFLPEHAIVYFNTYPLDSFSRQAPTSALGKIAAHREVADFLEEIQGQFEDYVSTAAESAQIDPEFFGEVLKAQACGAVFAPDASSAGPVIVFGLQFQKPQDRNRIFGILKAIAQRLIDGEIPAGVETVEGQPVLSLTTPDDNPYTPDINYFCLIDNLLIFTHSKPMMTQILSRARQGTGTLAQNPLFRRIVAETHVTPESGFAYLHTQGITMLLSALAPRETVNLLNALGVPSVMAVGYSCSFTPEGMRDTVYLHAPYRPGEGMPRVGILDMLTMKGQAETLPVTVPDNAQFVLSARISPSRLFDRVTKLMDAAEEALGVPLFDGSMKTISQMHATFGIQPAEALATLGDMMVLSVSPDGIIARFDNAQPDAFKAIAEKMEKNYNAPFSAATEDKVVIRYVNRTGHPIPTAPSYAVVGKTSILIATHPQAIKAYLRRDKANPTGVITNDADYQRVLTGLRATAGTDIGVLMYLDTKDSFTRVYNALLPISNALTAIPQISIDPGLLPPGNELAHAFFGTGVCMRNSEHGITFVVFSPIGVNGGLVYALDSLVVNNPVATGLLAAQFSQWLSGDAEPTTGPVVPVGSSPLPRR